MHTVHTRPAPPRSPNTSKTTPNTSPYPARHIPQPSTQAHACSYRRAGTACDRARLAPRTSHTFPCCPKLGVLGRTTRLQGAVQTHGRTRTVTTGKADSAWRARRCRRAELNTFGCERLPALGYEKRSSAVNVIDGEAAERVRDEPNKPAHSRRTACLVQWR
jgi:hypothetical protein